MGLSIREEGGRGVFSVFGVENPLMDIIAHVGYDFLERFRKQPGTMHLVDHDEVARLLKELPDFRTVPGGSAANTARGISWLAGPAGRRLLQSFPAVARNSPGPSVPVFNGAVGRDAIGDQFVQRMEAAGVSASIVRKATPTGTSVILVTPDGERTMNTFLGACRDFDSADLDLPKLAASRVLYLTGYLWDTENQKQAAARAAEHIRQSRRECVVAFDLADSFAVRRYADSFRAWIPGRVDILFGNRDELAILTGSKCDEDCVTDAAALAPLVVMKIGEKGCLVGQGGRLDLVPGVPAKVVDTTGAGDAFAAGFLYGILEGAEPVECARLANAIASYIVGREGCDYG